MSRKRKHAAAQAALATYVAQATGTASEPIDWQVSDLITDLLLDLPEEMADDVLRRAERDNRMDRA